MKSFTAVAFVALALCALVSTKSIETKFADKDFLVKQKFILDIFQHIYQDDIFVTKFDESYTTYKPWEHTEDYNEVEKIKEFFDLWQHKPMHDDEIFSPIYERHNEYAYGIGRILYHAKSWEVFTRAVYWARVNVNKQLFVYALNMMTMLREDLYGVVVPAVYEIHPWHFFDVETLETAERYQMHGFHNVNKLDNIYNAVIKSNYSNVYGDYNYENNLAYFTEDIGFNAFYYHYNLAYAYWTQGPEAHRFNKDKVGELYLYMHRQLLARYYLERLSNDLGGIPELSLYQNYEYGYYSNLRYYKGVSFPSRDDQYNFYYADNYELIKNVEYYGARVAEFIDTTTDEFHVAVEKLGNILQGNENSINQQLYGSLDNLYREIVNVGPNYGKYGETLPSTLMQYETSLRDPLFYSIYQEIMGYYWRLADNFPEYTTKDLEFPGVKIDQVHMPESLTTYFEYYDADISNAVNVETAETATTKTTDALYQFGRNSVHNGQSFVIKARQYRMNHKPFEFTLDVTSDKAQKAIVKVFIGPKYDENGHAFTLDKNYMNFFELEHYVVDLVAGTNQLKRNSKDFSYWVNDRTTYLELYQKLMDATNSDYQFPLSNGNCGIPQRIMLPIGKKGGLTFQFFFVVYPYHAPEVPQFSTFDPAISCGIGSGSRYIDALPFGFPFDRAVTHDYNFNVDNFKFHDVEIYHKDDTTNVV